MNMLRAAVYSFSMYSRIPMPRLSLTKEDARYMFCFFPLVGGAVGILSAFVYSVLTRLGMGASLKGAILCVIPIWITGGIHMDGFLDTIDAKSSWADRERKLAILKDSHTGAFAIIYGVLYEILCFGLFTEITPGLIGFTSIGYVYSRALSGLGAVVFKQARTEGTLAELAECTRRRGVIGAMAVYIAVSCAAMIHLNPVYGGACTGAGMIAFIYYKQMAYREFGGITGDLAGYFVQICELAVLGAVVILKCAGVQ